MKKAAAYCMTRNLYQSTITPIKSLLANSDVDTVYLLIEDDEYPFKHPKIKTINVSDQQFFPVGSLNYGNPTFTYMAMMRVTLCHYLKEDRVLSLDCDTIVDGDISELWELPLDDYYLAGGREPDKSHDGIYVNVGVTMYNLKKMREGMADRIIDALNSRWFAFLEQDATNELCKGKILEFPPEYNVHYWSAPTDKKPVIIHYAGIPVHDWKDKPLVKKYEAMEV